MERNISEDLKISKLHLDDAAESQGEKERHYGDAVADAQKVRDEAEARLKLRQGELWIELKGVQVNGKAATETDAKSMVAKHPEAVQLEQALIDSAYSLKLAQSAERAIQSTKSMIETLQRLHGASYFSTPNGNKPTGRENLPGYRPEA